MIAQGRLEPATFCMRGGRANHCTNFLTHLNTYQNPNQWKPNPDPIFTSDHFFIHGIYCWYGTKKLAHNLSLRLSAEPDFMYVPVSVLYPL